jgi:hypothetical protein
MTLLLARLHEVSDAIPPWVHSLIIASSAVVSWLAPIASAVAILWGCLQMYLAIEKRWFRKDK